MTPREEVFNALNTACKMLAADESMTGLRLNLLLATLDHAMNSDCREDECPCGVFIPTE